MIGIQYYVTGRAAVVAGFLVSGNLFHHAIEMILKYLLRNKYTEKQLKDVFCHDLKKLWREFKKAANDSALSRFDGIVSALNRFEDLRYPKTSFAFSIPYHKGPRSLASGPTMKNVKQYHISLEEIDELVTALLTGRVTPEYFKGLLMGDEAKVQYQRENQHSFI